MQRRTTIIAICFIVLVAGALYPSQAHAWSVPNYLKTYTVWNQFDATVSTFQRIGLIMSDSRYRGLFFGIIAMGLLLSGIMTIGKQLFRGQSPLSGWLSWFLIGVMGMIIYITFIRPTDQITIYDEALNETTTVGGIPKGVIVVAGLTNLVEKGFVDMIWTSATPQSYKENAGGLTLNIYDKAFSGGVNLAGGSTNGDYINASLRSYIEDCLFFEMTRSGSTVSMNQINTATDFRPILANASNPAIYTIWYSETYKGGLTVTCQDDWNLYLGPYLNSLSSSQADVQKFWQERCAAAGLGANSTAGSGTNLTNICMQKAQNMTGLIFGGTTYNPTQLFRQYLVASAMFNVVTKYSPDKAISTLASRGAGNTLVGMGIMADEWIPIIRSTVFAIFVGMLPFMCLFLATPLFGRAASLIFGAFLFLAVWTICDALVHSFAIDKMLDLFQEISNHNLGFLSMMLFSDRSARALAMFGAARWSAIMLAGVFTMMLVRFGGSALAHFAAGMSGIRQYGAGSAEINMNPVKWQSEVKALTTGFARARTVANAPRAAITAESFNTLRSIEAGAGAVATLGGGSVSLAAAKTAGSDVLRLQEGVAHTNAVQSYAASHGMTTGQVTQAIANYQTGSQAGVATALNNLAESLHTSVFGAMDFLKDVGLKTQYGQAQGLQKAYDNAVKQGGFKGSFNDYIAMMSQVEKEKAWANANAIKTYADSYFGGNEQQALQSVADYQQYQAFGAISEMRKRGISPAAFGQFMGRIHTLEQLAKSELASTLGLNGMLRVKTAELYNEASKFVLRRAVNDIAETGHVRTDTRAMLRELGATEIGREQLRAQGASMSFTISPEQAHNFGQHLRSQGVDITDSFLSGATVNAGWTVDKQGNLTPTITSVKKGQEVMELNKTTIDHSKTQVGWIGTFAGMRYFGTRKDIGGGMVVIDGATSDGHSVKSVKLVGTTTGGKETVVSKSLDQGYHYKNALFMAASGTVPREVISGRNIAASIAFGTALSNDTAKLLQGRITKEDLINRISDFQAGLSAKYGVNIGGGKIWQHIVKDSESTAADLITYGTMAIDYSGLTPRQKQDAYQEFVAMLGTLDPQHLPSASKVLHDASQPFGEIRQYEPSPTERVKDTLRQLDQKVQQTIQDVKGRIHEAPSSPETKSSDQSEK